MSTSLSSRISSGGIQKRSSGGGRARVDRDGDLDMDASGGARGAGGGRGGRGGRRGGRNVNINGAPRGPAADRTGSGSGAGRGGRISSRIPVGTRPRGGAASSPSRRGGQPARSGTLLGVRVEGWKQSKGSAEECVRFLERKTSLRFRKTQKQGEFLIVYVPASDLQSVLDWDKARFAGVNLKITADLMSDMFNTAMEDATPTSSSTAETIKILEEVLRNRYNPETKLLDLSKLGEDPLLQRNGFFQLNSTTSKMFPALMAVAEKKFDSPQQKREFVHSVSLAYNSLKLITPVTTLSITFPDLKNLSMEGNEIEDLKSLDGWKSRFRHLEQLIFAGNPVASLATYREEMIRRYPRLVMLDNIAVERPAENSDECLLLPVRPNLMFDERGIVMPFLSDFFTQIDNNKDGVLAKFYTAESQFSYSVNTSSPRIKEISDSAQYWPAYLPKSRNLKRIFKESDAEDRLYIGPDKIRKSWNSLPATQHMLNNQDAWSFDSFPVEISEGVPGMLVMAHGEFDELNPVVGDAVKRSFDRVFTLWIDGAGAIKIVNDLLVVRAYGGVSAWKVTPEAPPAAAAAAAPAAAVAGIQPPMQPAPSAPTEDEKRQKCQMLAEKTGLTLAFAEMCLADTNWELAAAWNAYMWAKENGKLGPEAFAATATA